MHGEIRGKACSDNRHIGESGSDQAPDVRWFAIGLIGIVFYLKRSRACARGPGNALFGREILVQGMALEHC